MYASATTYVDVIPQIYLYFPSPSRAQRRSHHPTTTRVPLSGHAYGSETACHNRTARISSTHTAAIDDPHTARGDLPRPPCVTPRTHARRVRSHGPRPGPRVPPSHYRLGVTRMQIYAPLRTPSTSHRCTPHARHSTTRPSPPHAHACEPERRRTHRSPSTPQPTPLPSRPNRTHSTFLPAALYKTPSILTHRSPRTQNPSSGAAPRVGAASPALPYGGGAQSNANQDVSMPGTSDGRSRARTNIRPSPPRGGGAARPPVRGRAHTDQSSRPSRLPISCWLAGVRRGVGGRGCGPGSCG